MKTKQEIRQIAEDLFFEHCEDKTVDSIIEVIILFAKQMCELQKEECEDFEYWNRQDIEFNKTNITNCRNVCEN